MPCGLGLSAHSRVQRSPTDQDRIEGRERLPLGPRAVVPEQSEQLGGHQRDVAPTGQLFPCRLEGLLEQHRLGPGHHGPVEHLHARDVRRRQVQHPLPRTTEPLLRGQRARPHRVTREHHPLRFAGRPRGRDHQRLGVERRVPLAQQCEDSSPCRRAAGDGAQAVPHETPGQRKLGTQCNCGRPTDTIPPMTTPAPTISSGSRAPGRARCRPRCRRCSPGPRSRCGSGKPSGGRRCSRWPCRCCCRSG